MNNTLSFSPNTLLLTVCFGLLTTLAEAAEVMVSAVSGNPLGVATIEIPLASPVPVGSLPRLRATGSAGQVLYPASSEVRMRVTPPSERPVPQPGRGRLLGRVGSLIRELTGADQDKEATVARRVSFLFPSDEPFLVTLGDSDGPIGQYKLVPEKEPLLHDERLRQWWADYTTGVKTQIDLSDYPPWVETYLVAMLSGRLRLPLPDWYETHPSNEDALVSTLKLIAGAEDEKEVVFRQAAAGRMSADPLASTKVTLPAAPSWAPSFPQGNRPPQSPSIPVEPLAGSVPPECFYLRYGSFENYLWFTDLSNEYGGDLSRMATLRGFRTQATESLESQLNLKMTQMSRMLGPTMIEDQAIIGRDLFLNDGASIGVLFQVSNVFLFRSSLQNDRSTRAGSDETIKLSDTRIGGKSVSFLRSADNRVRSFLVENGNMILVTNSKTLVQRFLEVAAGAPSLAQSPEFQLTRQLMPLEREDTVFAYLSPRMMQGLVSPEYLIELRRRLASQAEITLVHLARMASAAEGNPIQSIDQLVAAGYLPADFSQRSDGSGVVSLGAGLIDTRRGARGRFLPIADVKMKSVTAEEAAWYETIAAAYSNRFSHMDPIMIGVRREGVSDGKDDTPKLERLSIHAEVAPLTPAQYGKWAQQLGPPTRVAIQFAADDLVAAQAHVASELLGPPTHLFAAIKDSSPPDLEDFDGLLKSYRSLRQLPGYLGAWPLPGALDRLPLGIGRGTPVGPGMTRLIGGLYRYTGGGFSVLSFFPDILTASLPYWASVEVEDAAQVRARIGDLVGSQLEGWVTDQLYHRSSQTSAAGAQFLGMLSRQLKVNPDQAMGSIADIFGTDLQCTLGGRYLYDADAFHWKSTAWAANRPPIDPPLGYTPPLLQWFRGGQATLTQYDDRVVVDAVVDAQRQ
ncbi:hypothetical protein [Novipirellula artificiosorum]|nr:hypothetical protein [Novipirellula artificiosorum]